MNKETANETVESTAKRAIKDSVFRNLFLDKKYLIQLYQCLHPEDDQTKTDDLEYVTLENVLINDIYNDLGFLVNDRLLILVEAQSTWTVNIIIRCLMYIAKTYQDYFSRTEQSIYSTTKIRIPAPELYVVYTGTETINKNVISLSEEFFKGQETALDVRVNVIIDGKTGDIINQYVVFCKVVNEQVRIYGRTRKAVEEAIKICKEQNVLRDYLAEKEMEVVDIMMTLYSQDQAIEDYVTSRERESSIRTTVEWCKYFGCDMKETAQKVAQKFQISLDWATEKTKMYW